MSFEILVFHKGQITEGRSELKDDLANFIGQKRASTLKPLDVWPQLPGLHLP